METLQISTYLSAATALALGSTVHGEILVAPTAEQLSGLSSEQRTELARYVSTAIPARLLSVAAIGWSGVLSALDSACADRARDAANLEAAIESERESYRQILADGRYYDDGLPLRERKHAVQWDSAPNYSRDDSEAQRLWSEIDRAREAERTRRILEADAALEYARDGDTPAEPIRLVLDAATRYKGGRYQTDPVPLRATEFARRAKAEVETERAKCLAENKRLERGLLTDYGTADQVERYDAGVLPEEEFDRIAKKHLFAPLEEFAIYESLKDADVEHRDGCYEPNIKFWSEEYTGPLDADEFSRLKSIKAKAPEGSAISLREHRGSCRSCESEAVIRLGVRVSIEWAGETYQREYAIG